MESFDGLSRAEAKRRLAVYGENRLAKAPRVTGLSLLIGQFKSPLMLVLLGAFFLTWWLHDYADAIVIGLGLLVNGALGFWQEFRAERSLEALQQVLSKMVTVLRDRDQKRILQAELVPGDVVLLSAGERVSADGVIITGHELLLNEAVLTGEAVGVPKKTEEPVYAGTAVMAGEGLMRVTRTGMKTRIGGIAGLLIKMPRTQTPLQRQLTQLGRRLSTLVLMIVVLILIFGIFRGRPLIDMVRVAVAIAVAAIPEGLVISLTAILAVGMQRILQRKALVRKLLAAEVLGSVSVICSDKTGTLTEGVMRVARVITSDPDTMRQAAILATGGADQLEVSLREWGEGGLSSTQIQAIRERGTVISRQPFVPEKKYSLTVTHMGTFMVGAPEVLLSKSSLSPAARERQMQQVRAYATKNYRVVGVLTQTKGKRWHFVGLVLFEDKVRQHLRRIFHEVREAGIAVKVITGDYAETAVAVLSHCGVRLLPHEVMLGEEIGELEPEMLASRVGEVSLFARTTPGQKLAIVNALQHNGEVVAMTGDGVNDAPALKRADVGIVVSTAADVATETADMVLLDNNFGTIVAAVEEGRGSFKNLRKVVLYLLSDSMTQVLLVLGSLIMQWPLLITTIQVLWINLLTDSLPALALTVDPHTLDLMKQPPRSRQEPIINRVMMTLMGVISLTTAVLVFAVFSWQYQVAGWPLLKAQTYAFTLLSVSSLLFVFPARSMQTPLLKDKWWRNRYLILAVVTGILIQGLIVYVPFLQNLFGTVALNGRDWLGIVLGSIGVVLVVEGGKAGFRR